jgi:5'(3')-deoxyribonucleotidase
MIEKIFIDLDDVLNDFTLYALGRMGCPVEPADYCAYDPGWGWDIVRAYNSFFANDVIDERTFWEELPKDVWSRAPKSAICETILGFAEMLVGTSNVCILTSPTLDPLCAAGKMVWIKRNLPVRLHRRFAICPCKDMCASPNALLIDDSDKNIEAFHHEGGHTILVPRPWNSKHGQDAEYYIRLGMENIIKAGVL